MRFLIQRVQQAAVSIDGREVAAIKKGYVVLVGISPTDHTILAQKMLDKLCKLRIFSDENGKTNLSIQDAAGEILLVSQFTLYANCKKGNRPSFTENAPAEQARQLFSELLELCRNNGIPTKSGVFGADMQISLINDGPFTVLLDSRELFNE
ncbi:MAG: D-aminoacyl-tRNA deacylase [Eubacteriales bacterium]|nr:D-aminoacyl-tRNA deacylase [Eubacteriales bacterium]